MSSALLYTLLLLACAALTNAGKCESPKHSSTTFSTTDAFFHFHTTFIAEFALQCANNVRDVPFYAVIGDQQYGVSVSEETLRYQVSWHLPHDQSSSQTFDIKIYDEDRFEEYKKSSNPGSVQPLFTISHYHAGVDKKFPLSPGTVFLGVAVIALYFASGFRAELKS